MASQSIKVTYSNKRALPHKPVVVARRLPRNATRKG